MKDAFVRGGPVSDTVAFLDVYQTGLLARVEAQIGRETLKSITSHGRMSWIPLEDDVVLVEGIAAVLGAAELVRFFRSSIAHHFQGKLLRTLISGAERLFGLTPHVLVKLVPRAWPMVYKNLGEPTIERRTDTLAVVHVTEAHPILLDSADYLRTWQGIFEGVVAAGGAEADRVQVDTCPFPAEARVEMHLHW